MKIQFDANQNFQLDAIAAVGDLFDGQPQGAPEFSVIKAAEDTELFAGQERSELGLGNRASARRQQAARRIRGPFRLGTTSRLLTRPRRWRGGSCSTAPPMRRACVHIFQSRWRRVRARPTSTCVRCSSFRGGIGFQEIHHRRSERRHSRRRPEEHRDHRGAFSRSLRQHAV